MMQAERSRLIPRKHTENIVFLTNIKTVLQQLDYDSHQWLICADSEIANFMLGRQSGYTKYPFFDLPVGQPSE